MAKLYVVGIGPGGQEHFTIKAIETIKKCQVVVGYTYYIKLIKDLIEYKEVIKTGMRGEIERCQKAIASVKNGKDTCIISTGDAGLYGMAGPILEMVEDIDVEIVPGVSSVFAAAAEVGAPLMHDFCSISLSDLLTPWDVIEKRLVHAAQADFVIALYNPKSKGRVEHIKKAVKLIKENINNNRQVAMVKNAGRDGNERILTDLENIDFDFIDMKTVVIIGNSCTFKKGNFLVTPRGYHI